MTIIWNIHGQASDFVVVDRLVASRPYRTARCFTGGDTLGGRWPPLWARLHAERMVLPALSSARYNRGAWPRTGMRLIVSAGGAEQPSGVPMASRSDLVDACLQPGRSSLGPIASVRLFAGSGRPGPQRFR